MALLASHLEQIELCASTISELPFPAPGIFTNALLHFPDITALLRDPDVHESALFTVITAQELGTNSSNDTRGGTTSALGDKATDLTTRYAVPRRHTAVAAVLGTDMAERIRRQRTGDTPWARRRTGLQKDELDIELLLNGAEKLCKAYPIAGVTERSTALRSRHTKVIGSIAQYETMVAEQTAQLRMMGGLNSYITDDLEMAVDDSGHDQRSHVQVLTQDDLRREEDLVKELESRKRTLEERVDGMKKDLGGILR